MCLRTELWMVDWIWGPQDKVQRLVVTNAALNIRVLKNIRLSWLSEQLSVSQILWTMICTQLLKHLLADDTATWRNAVTQRSLKWLCCAVRCCAVLCFDWNVGIFLDNDQLEAHLLYFTIRPLQSSTCFERYMFIITRLNCIDAASGIVLWVSGHPLHRFRENHFSLNLCTGQPLTESDDSSCCINTIQPPDDEHEMLETCRGL